MNLVKPDLWNPSSFFILLHFVIAVHELVSKKIDLDV